MENDEKWLWIPGYEDRYSISDYGRVRSHIFHQDGKLLALVVRKKRGLTPYLNVCLRSSDKIQKSLTVHSLVLRTFVGDRPDGCEGCHNDGDPSNNRLTNLRWDTRSANSQDSLRHGTKRIGLAHHFTKLTEEDIRCIRAEPEYFGVGRMLARCFGISRSHISRIRRGEGQPHVPLLPAI